MKNVTVCTFKTSPCVPAPRAHMSQHVCAWCRYTRGRFERTHGDVLSGHTAPHTTPQTHQNTTRRQRKRQRQRQREKRRRKRRDKDKRREDKRRQKREVRRFFFQCGGAWPFFFVGVVICLVNPVCARVLGLLNSVKHDSF